MLAAVSASLDRLALRLGGTIRIGTHCWLDTRIGNLRAAVIVRHLPLTSRRILDIAVFMPGSRMAHPFGRRWWSLNHLVMPPLGHGFVFMGCRDGVLQARSFEPRDVEEVVGALRALASWAHLPWGPVLVTKPDPERRWFRDRATSFGAALIVVVLVLIWRGIGPD